MCSASIISLLGTEILRSAEGHFRLGQGLWKLCRPPPNTQIILDLLGVSYISWLLCICLPDLVAYVCIRTSDNDVSLICCHWVVLLSFCVAFPSAISGKCFLEVSFCSLAVYFPLLGHMSQNPFLELFCSLSTKRSLRCSTLPTFILSFSHSANTYWGYSICQELDKAPRYKDKQS